MSVYMFDYVHEFVRVCFLAYHARSIKHIKATVTTRVSLQIRGSIQLLLVRQPTHMRLEIQLLT